MPSETFKHNGASFTVRARTIFDQQMTPINTIAVTIASKLTPQEGGGEDISDISPLLWGQLQTFARLASATTIEGDIEMAHCTVYAQSETLLAYYRDWLRLMQSDDGLFKQWVEVYDKLNKVPDPES